jgi:hypothetical protein
MVRVERERVGFDEFLTRTLLVYRPGRLGAHEEMYEQSYGQNFCDRCCCVLIQTCSGATLAQKIQPTLPGGKIRTSRGVKEQI